MIRLAVLDDEQKELTGILSLLESFKQAHPERTVTAKAFTDPYELLDYTQSNGGFDIYLLDIIMRNMTGIECAQKLRKRGDSGEIVFLTTSREYGVDAFGVNAAGYLIKPIKSAALFERLLAVLERISLREPLFVKLCGGDVRAVRPEEIVCIESFRKKQEIHLSDGSVLQTQQSLSDWRERLKDYQEFYSPHRSYIVNFEHVTSIGSDGLTVGGYKIPVPRAVFKTVQNCFFEYLLNKQK